MRVYAMMWGNFDKIYSFIYFKVDLILLFYSIIKCIDGIMLIVNLSTENIYKCNHQIIFLIKVYSV